MATLENQEQETDLIIKDDTKTIDENSNAEITDADKSSTGYEINDTVQVIVTNDDQVRKDLDSFAHQFAIPDLPVVSTNTDKNKKCSVETEKSNGKIASKKTLTTKPKEPLNDKKSNFPYTPPPWGGIPPPEKKYSLTVLKEGIVRDTIDLTGKSTLTFGRHPTACNVLVEHPSCSRYHAVLQYSVEEKDLRKVGYYLYDMGSTHGCYVNKERMRPKVYVRVRVGYQIKFGGSSRRYVVEGPCEDQEEEADMEEVQTAREKRKQIKQVKESSTECGKESGDGASWGFGEDAQEEELDLHALMEKKKSIEVKDPKKTLKGFFDREGLDFEYEMSERGRGNNIIHVAQVHLPIESSLGIEIIAEGTSSCKKDAVLNCATDACKIIQAYDMMQNPVREDEREKRQRELEANDFYDSDDDNYLDRTGSIERKRLKRKQFAGKTEKVEVSTHESLKVELSEKQKQLSNLEHKLILSNESDETEDGDSLDAFMSNIGNKLDKKAKLQLKRQIVEVRKDVEKLTKLVEKTQPSLPALSVYKEEEAPMQDVVPDLPIPDADDELNNHATKEDKESILNEAAPNKEKAERNTDTVSTHSSPKKKRKNRVLGPSAPKDDPRDMDEKTKEKKELVEWQPPEGQTGDGRTHLNDKFGY